MKTPIKYGYGKRKRLSSASHIQWDESIDTIASSKDSDELTITPVTTSSTRRVLSPTSKPRIVTTPSAKKRSSSTTSIFDFGSTQPRASRQKRVTVETVTEPTSFTSEKQDKQARSIDKPTVQQQNTTTNSRNRSQVAKRPRTPENVVSTKPTRKSPRSQATNREKGKQKASYDETESASELDAALNASEKLKTEKYEAELQEAVQRSRKQTKHCAGEGSATDMAESQPEQSSAASKNPSRRLHSPGPIDDIGAVVSHDVPDSDHAEVSDDDLTMRVEDNHTPDRVIPLSSEIDLEPVFRPRTPLQRWPGIKDTSPYVSPEHASVFDIFNEDASAKRPTSLRSRRVMGLNKSSPSKIAVDSAELENLSESLSLDRLVEDAENNLKERSQLTAESTMAPRELYNANEPKAPQVTSTKITYSMQRSFLVDALEDTVPGTGPISLAPSPGIDTDDDDDAESEPGAGKPSIKNLYDLRQGGENKRFADEISYLLEGLQSERSKQSALIELARKLSSKEFARRFKAADFDVKVMAASQKLDDPVSLFALMIIMSVLSQGVESMVLTTKQRNLLKQAMHYEKDIADYLVDKRTKVSKLNRISTQELKTHLESSEAFSQLHTEYRLSPRLLALMNIGYQVDRNSDFVIKLIIPMIKSYLPVKESLMVELQLISTMLETIKPETLPLAAFPKNQMAALCQIVKGLLDEDRHEHDSRATTVCSILRFLIGLANTLSEIIPIIVKSDFVEYLLTFLASQSRTLGDGDDEMVLCLGLLVCLAEESEQARTVMRERRK